MTRKPTSRTSAPFTVAIRVQPASSRTSVGGRRGDALLVRVTEPAVDGRATEAALAAVARALGVRRQEVHLVRGMASRDKVVAVECPDHECPDKESRLAQIVTELGSGPR